MEMTFAVREVNSREVVPAQTVDATPSDQLMRRCFRWAIDPSGWVQLDLNRAVRFMHYARG